MKYIIYTKEIHDRDFQYEDLFYIIECENVNEIYDNIDKILGVYLRRFMDDEYDEDDLQNFKKRLYENAGEIRDGDTKLYIVECGWDTKL